MTLDLSRLQPAIEQLARKAGQVIMAIYARDFSIAEKGDKSPLTEADSAAHHLIVQGLEALDTGIPIFSEEDLQGFSGADDEGRYWLVDPLDGTKEFIKRNGEFTVNIALIEKGVPVLGVVDAPALQKAYSAAQGLGASKLTYDDQGQETSRQPIQACQQKPRQWRVVGSRSHTSEAMQDWLQRLDDYTMLPMGSSLKLCLVAEGEADVYPRLGPTCLWDTGAAHAVVLEAGGQVTTLEGQPLDYSHTAETLNPWFLVVANDLLKEIKS
ncbi:3'(2'),5'-bisphosphate nucleotidase CysQ [Marinospirillum sp.]|uniref:3'(2'),5'-bisphosphate nucleotidase CysQ n=1 Tax=Marinospirillum sp. TaxID=2183934 RepID=UPI00384E8FEE